MDKKSDVGASCILPHKLSPRNIPKQNFRFSVYAMTCFKDLYNYEETPSQFNIMQYATSMSSYSKMKPGWLSANTIDIASTANGPSMPQVFTNSEKTPLYIQGAAKS